MRIGEEIVYGDTLTWDGNAEGLEELLIDSQYTMYKVHDKDTILEDGTECTFSLRDSTTGELVYDNVSGIVVVNSNGSIVVTSDICAYVMVSGSGWGTYLLKNDKGYASSITFPDYTGFVKTNIKAFDEKYIPDTIQRVGEPLYLTDANGVKYQLTVGTDGTLSAAAVTE